MVVVKDGDSGVIWRDVSVELLLVEIPLDRVQDVALHLKVADQSCAVADDPMRRNVNVVKDQREATWNEQNETFGSV